MEAYRTQLLREGDVIEGEHLEPVLEPQASFVLMDQRTGEVKALGGGRGEKTASLTLNRAAAMARQPGSAFKVIAAFAPALDTGRGTLGSVSYDEPYGVGGHMFRNWWGNRGYLGYSNIRDGITYSMNIVAVRTMMEIITPEIGIEYARNMGITTLTPEDVTASAALGGLTEGVTNLQLTGAYASIANRGTYVSPRFFTRILNRQGNILLDARQEERRVLKDSTAFLLTDAMEDSMENRRIFAREGISISATSPRRRLNRCLRQERAARRPITGMCGLLDLLTTIRRESGADMMRIISPWKIPISIRIYGNGSWTGFMRICRPGNLQCRIASQK